MSRATSVALLSGVTLVSLAGLGCARRGELRLEGRTMGTTYHVTAVTGGAADGLQGRIDRRLDEINGQLSTWIEGSEISRFNRLATVGQVFPISEDFRRVMAVAAEVHALSGGAWDGTVNPLVALWGFGPEGSTASAPSPERIAAARAQVGFGKIEARPGGALVKLQPGVTLDLSSIAKGYGVDAIADLLRAEGLEGFVVEIGGEVRAAGVRRDGRPWRVGINRPDPEAEPGEVYRVVSVRDAALATSGDYRNYVLEGGQRRSHVIDPRTGEPVSNGVVSVSILAPTCTLADGLATAVMVMGPERGLELIEGLDGVEALVLLARRGGFLEEHASSGFRAEPAPGRQ